MVLQQAEPAATTAQFADLIGLVAREHDTAAFELLFHHYGPRVRSYVLRRTGDPRLADELVQETMLAIWRKAALYNPVRGEPGAWIYTIARNLLISALRRDARPAIDVDDPAFVPAAEPSAEVGYAASEDADRLRQAMDRLPPEQRDLLTRAFFAERSHARIAAELGLPLGTVKSRIRAAFARLRAALQPEDHA